MASQGAVLTGLEDVLRELLLQLLVGVVDAQLLEPAAAAAAAASRTHGTTAHRNRVTMTAQHLLSHDRGAALAAQRLCFTCKRWRSHRRILSATRATAHLLTRKLSKPKMSSRAMVPVAAAAAAAAAAADPAFTLERAPGRKPAPPAKTLPRCPLGGEAGARALVLALMRATSQSNRLLYRAWGRRRWERAERMVGASIHAHAHTV
jgi:hypothetical protein